ncbi:MAG TPA: hypothetical protein VKR58_07535 [Aquella sp.]|nr:hypothetical protein [Aquella sp.]
MKNFKIVSILLCFSCIFMLADEMVIAPALLSTIGSTAALKKFIYCSPKASNSGTHTIQIPPYNKTEKIYSML